MMDDEKYALENCRICKAKVIRFLDLGATHPPEEFRTKEELGNPIITFPLGLSYCPQCGEVQLSHETPPDIMYRQNYFYDYSAATTWEKHWVEYVNSTMDRYKLGKDDLVVDIGSNTGKLLEVFKGMGMKVQGVDPSPRLIKIAREKGIPTIDSYFNEETARQIVASMGKAKAITCNNVFDHVTDLHEFMRAINILLKEDGIYVAEVPYFATFYKTHGHVVYQQQIDYLLVRPFMRLFDMHNMELVDCKEVDRHGGSIRLYIAFKGRYKPSDDVALFVKREEELFRNMGLAMESFAASLLAQKYELVSVIKRLKSEGKSIGAVGASAKGNVLLFYSGLGSALIDFITEQSELKLGRYTPSGIPIIREGELSKRMPDYVLLLAWNYADEVFNKFKDYADKGGKFIVPIPATRIMERKR